MGKMGTIEIVPGRGADQNVGAVAEYDAIAVHGSELLFVSLYGSAAELKVMRAAANSGGSIPCTWMASGLRVLKPADRIKRYRRAGREPGRCVTSIDGYQVHRHRLGYGQEHQLFISRKPGFLLVASDETVWQELKSDRITTPVIREWLPYIAGRLREQSLLSECEVYPFEKQMPEALRGGDWEPDENPPHAPVLSSAVFTACTRDVDAIVVAGLKSGAICIPATQQPQSEH